MRLVPLIPVFLGFLLVGCAQMKRTIAEIGGVAPGGPAQPEIPDKLKSNRGGGVSPLTRVSLEGEGGVPVTQLRPGAEMPEGIPDQEDIVFTDPDNPYAPLEGLEASLSSASEKVGGWNVSYTESTRDAVREGKPLLVWFTDTKWSPLCKNLSAEVFSDAAFEEWASANLIRLRLDLNAVGDSEDEELRKKKYLAKLKKRYGVTGLPTVLVMAPDGTVTGRYKGYRRGQGDFYFGRVRNAARTAEKQTESWKAEMERKGYRVWKNREGKPVFAKLLRYRPEELLLVEPSGKRLTAKMRQLSEDDQEWIRAELAKRGR